MAPGKSIRICRGTVCFSLISLTGCKEVNEPIYGLTPTSRTGGGTDYNPASAAVNVQVWRMDFSFEEILPEYDYV